MADMNAIHVAGSWIVIRTTDEFGSRIGLLRPSVTLMMEIKLMNLTDT
jgi:hypothetical protein